MRSLRRRFFLRVAALPLRCEGLLTVIEAMGSLLRGRVARRVWEAIVLRAGRRKIAPPRAGKVGDDGELQDGHEATRALRDDDLVVGTGLAFGPERESRVFPSAESAAITSLGQGPGNWSRNRARAESLYQSLPCLRP